VRKLFLGALLLILSLGVIGVGYARWPDAVLIDMHSSTGIVKAGIRCVGVSNGGCCHCCGCGKKSPAPPGAGWSNGSPVGNIHGNTYFESVDLNIINGCQCHAPIYTVEIGNCGTIPVRIEELSLEWSYNCDYNLKRWTLSNPRGSQSSGSGIPSLQNAVKGTVIDPENKVYLDLQFCTSTECNQLSRVTLSVDYCSWNKRLCSRL
jgi:hypothetical protein